MKNRSPIATRIIDAAASISLLVIGSVTVALTVALECVFLKMFLQELFK